MSKIGFIGLGVMGKPMASNLIKGGASLMVNDLDTARVEEVCRLGAIRGTYEEMARRCDVILMILPKGPIVKDILFGKGRLAEYLCPGKLVCDLSSVTPAESRFCYDSLKERGIDFVDAPVSGGEPGAIAGTLSIMCGGDEDAIEKLRPCLAMIGSTVMRVGGSGCGSAVKLANQIIVNLNIATISEALVFVSKAGVDPMTAYQAMRGGFAASAVMDAKAPRICARDFSPSAPIAIIHKDIKNVLETAHAIDVPVPLSAQLFEMLQALKAGGHMMDDHAGIVQYFEQLAQMEVRSDRTAASSGQTR